jgi:hypothetical protein
LDRRGALLAGSRRRLATLDSLGITTGEPVDDSAAVRIVSDCAGYFERRPYGRWFDALDRVLRRGLGVSYYDRSASHLDLVQWATSPVWGRLDTTVRTRLLKADVPFLEQQLTRGGWRVVVVNGRTVMNWVAEAGLLRWEEVARLAGPPTASVCIGDRPGGPLFVGWSCNLQSQHGARALAPDLVGALGEMAGAALGGRVLEAGS